MSTDFVVEMEDVAYAYDVGGPVLSGITLRIPRGKVVAIMGGSGSGKTTLLRLIGGMLRATSGEVKVFGRSMQSCAPRSSTSNASAWACCSSSAHCSPTSRCSRTSPSRCASVRSCPIGSSATWC